MRRTYSHKELTWIDLESPKKNEIRELMETYDIHPAIADDLVSPNERGKIDLYDDYIYLILHFPTAKHSHSKNRNQEIDFIISKDFLITVRYDTIDPIHKFAKEFEVNSVLKAQNIGEHAGFIFFHLIKKIYKSLEHELEYLSYEIGVIEQNIFSGGEKEMVQDISKTSRVLLDFTRAIRPHRGILDSLEVAAAKLYGEKFRYPIRNVIGKYERITTTIKSLREMVFELRETNNSLLSTKQNEVMKTLTIMAFVTFPLSLLAGIFGMNTTYLPLVGESYDFWVIVGTMMVLMVIFFAFFKYKKWL